MEKEQFLNILSKYLDNNATEQECQFLYAYYTLFIAEPDVVLLLNDQEKEKLKLSIKAGIYQHFNRVLPSQVTKPVRLWPKILVAASVLMVLTIGLTFFLNRKNADSNIYHNIAPGTSGATLTLSNGKKIKLIGKDPGKLAVESGITILKTTDGQLIYQLQSNKNELPNKENTLSTDRGETYSLILADGSKVWLNAASSITYSTALDKSGTRRVQLNGEAYFEVAKDKAHPFIVESKGQRVEVLGTHFNINSYADELSTKTTLLEGSVKVTSEAANDNNPKTEILKPNQQAILTSAEIRVKDVIADSFIDWKDGAFNFEDETLHAIMRKVSRWYNVDVVFNGTDNDTQTFSGTVSRSANISEVLQTLKDMSHLNFDIKGKKVLITK